MNDRSTLPWIETIGRLSERWREADSLLPAFPLLALGQPVEIDEIARASGITADRVTRALDAARCEREEAGRIIGLYGLTLTPTLHRLEIDRKVLFSCCALWAHVIPKLVDATVEIESIDPIRRERVRLSVSPQGLTGVDPPGAVATLAVSSQEAIDEDVCEAFCCQVCHFVSLESAEEFAAHRATCSVVDLAELQQAAQLLHQDIWSAVGV